VAETDLYDQSELADAVRLVVKAVEDSERRYHDAFVERVERRYMAYRGLADESPNPAPDDDDWHSNVTTPYVLNTCEGMLATMLEPNPRFNVQPRPKPDEPLAQVVERLKSVEAISDTLRYALERDKFAQKQRDFMQQDLIAGISVLKDYWAHERRDVTELAPDTITIENAYGETVDTITSHEEVVRTNALVRDDACCEVRDVRDFFWPAQAPNVEAAEWLVDRTWQTFAKLKRAEQDGYYKNVDELKKAGSAARLQDITRREQRLRNIDRTQDLVEVLEYWTPERVITVGNRTVLLRDDPNPFWNGRLPFIVCSAMPDAFQIPGISVVEALAQLQDMLWTLQNQRLDVVRLLANVITMIRSDVDDFEIYRFAPGEQWPVEDPSQVQVLPIDPTVAQITLQSESFIKGDLQNILGGLPGASGADQQTFDQQTATGVSIITTIAQRIIQSRKQHYLWSYAELGKHFLLLYQQFLRDDRPVRILGMEGARAYRTVTPLEIQGDFDVTIDVTSDSLMKQERIATAQALFQISVQAQPVMAQSGAPLNLKASFEKLLDAHGVPDKEAYFMPPQIGAATAGGPPQPPGQPPPVPPGPGGITNPGLAAGPTAPSNELSLSGESLTQRLMSQSGGVANGGGGGAPPY